MTMVILKCLVQQEYNYMINDTYQYDVWVSKVLKILYMLYWAYCAV